MTRPSLRQRIYPVYAKNLARLRRIRWLRKLLTRNFSTGKVAFGEKHQYALPYSWILVDNEDADVQIDLCSLKPFLFRAESLSVIYSAHMIEHLPENALIHFLNESYRTLKSGGFIRLEAPDAGKALQYYKDGDSSAYWDYFAAANQKHIVERLGFSSEYTAAHISLLGLFSCYIFKNTQIPVYASKMEVDLQLQKLSLNEFAAWCVSLQTPDQRQTGGHINYFTRQRLSHLLTQAGFRNVSCTENRKTAIPNIKITSIERVERGFYSLYMEAQK